MEERGARGATRRGVTFSSHYIYPNRRDDLAQCTRSPLPSPSAKVVLYPPLFYYPTFPSPPSNPHIRTHARTHPPSSTLSHFRPPPPSFPLTLPAL